MNKALILITTVLSFINISLIGQEEQGDQKAIIHIDLFHVLENDKAAYESGEMNIFKPYHQEKIKDGQMFGWALYKIAYPLGTDINLIKENTSKQNFNYLTLNFRNPSEAENKRSDEQQWKAAHPNLEQAQISKAVESFVKLRKQIGGYDWTPLGVVGSSTVGKYAIFNNSKLNTDVDKYYKSYSSYFKPVIEYLINNNESNLKAHFAGYINNKDGAAILNGFSIDSIDNLLDMNKEDWGKIMFAAHDNLTKEEVMSANKEFQSQLKLKHNILAVLVDSHFGE